MFSEKYFLKRNESPWRHLWNSHENYYCQSVITAIRKNELDELKLMQNILTAANILSYILSLDNMLLFRLKFFPDEFINVIAGLMHLLQDRSRKIWNCLHASAYVAFTSGLWLTGPLKRAYRVLVFSLCWK